MWSPTIKRTYSNIHAKVLGGALTVGPSDSNVAFTFDDGPDETWTPQVLNILDKYEAKATFFMLGERMEQFSDIAGEVAKRGHELASHLYSHDRSVADDDEMFRKELGKTVDLIREITGNGPGFLRFPFGELGKQKPDKIWEEFKVRVTHWSFSSMDSRFSAAQIVKRVEKLMFPGAIILIHDGVGSNSKYVKNRQATVDALPALLQNCRDRGFVPVTLSKMFEQSAKGPF